MPVDAAALRAALGLPLVEVNARTGSGTPALRELLAQGAAVRRAPSALVVHPVRPAPWGVSLMQQRKVLFDALLSIVIGALIAWGWPASSIAVIGALTGFWLIFSGAWRIIVEGRVPETGDARSI